MPFVDIMPNGPGIGSAGSLLNELVEEEAIRVKPILKGNYTGFRFRIRKKSSKSSLSKDAIDSIAFGVKQVQDRSAAAVSHHSHQVSRSWRNSINGQELNIYVDAIDDQEFEARDKGVTDIIAGLRSAMRN